MKPIIYFIAVLMISGCAGFPGAGPEVRAHKNACINSNNISFEIKDTDVYYVDWSIERELSSLGYTYIGKNPELRKENHILIKGIETKPYESASYVEFFVAAISLFIIPAYDYRVQEFSIERYEGNLMVDQFSVDDSEHYFVSIFAGFIGPKSPHWPENSRKTIGRRIARAIDSAVKCNASNHALNKDAPKSGATVS